MATEGSSPSRRRRRPSRRGPRPRRVASPGVEPDPTQLCARRRRPCLHPRRPSARVARASASRDPRRDPSRRRCRPRSAGSRRRWTASASARRFAGAWTMPSRPPDRPSRRRRRRRRARASRPRRRPSWQPRRPAWPSDVRAPCAPAPLFSASPLRRRHHRPAMSPSLRPCPLCSAIFWSPSCSSGSSSAPSLARSLLSLPRDAVFVGGRRWRWVETGGVRSGRVCFVGC